MIRVRVTASSSYRDYTIKEPVDAEIEFRPCAHCGHAMVQSPARTCSSRCRMALSRTNRVHHETTNVV